MDKKTVKDIISTYLKENEFTPQERKKIINNFYDGIKTVKKEKAIVRHGTTCLGIITDKERIVEW